jgi:hypothetical protein
MAVTALLRRGASTQSLTLTDELAPPDLNAEATVIGGTGTTDPRLVRETLGSPVQMQLPIYLSGATHADLQAAVDAVDTFLRGGECTLEITFNGASDATIWDVYHAQPVQPQLAHESQLKYWVQTTLKLTVSPFVRKAAVTLHDEAAVTAPGVLSLSAMTGIYRAPLTITAAATSADTHGLYLAVDSTSHGTFLSDAADLTWGAGATDTSDSDARSGTGVYVASVTAVTAAIDTSGYPEGPYLILARVKVRNSKTGYIATDYTDGVVTFTRGSWHIVELGTCYLPTRNVTGTTAADLVVSVYGSSASAGDEACIDWVYPVPLGDGMFSWHPATATVDATTIVRDAATGRTYVDGVANEQHVTGTTLMALGGNLLVIAEEAAGTDPTQALDVTVTYEPRFAWMR